MWKIFLISVGFCIFLPLQVEACALAFFDSLPVPVKKALREVGVHTIEDISLFSERDLIKILPAQSRQSGIEEIKAIFSNRGESLARDFLVDDIGLSFTTANILNRAGIHTEENLRKLTERELRDIFSEERIGIKEDVERIRVYLSNRGESLAQDLSIEGIGLRSHYVKALKAASIHTIEDLRRFSRRELMAILPGKERTGQFAVQKIVGYLSVRGESLARDFLIEDVGLSAEAAAGLREAGVRAAEDLHKISEKELKGIFSSQLIRSKEAIKQVKAYLSGRGESLAPGVLIEDIGLRPHYIEVLKESGIHTIADLRKFSRRELRTILPGTEQMKKIVTNKISLFLLNRGESLARDFLVGNVDLSFRDANALNRAGVRTAEDLLKWTENDLLDLPDVSRVAVEKIKAYLSRQGALAQDKTVEGVELSIETGRSSGRVDNYNMENLGTENQFGTLLPNGDPKQGGVRNSQKPPVVRLW